MAEVVLCVASTVAGCLVAPVDRLCGYVISYDSHVRELEAKVAELGNARQEVQKSIDYAQNNVKPIRAYVNKWVEDVDKHAEEARRALDDYRRANETCFYGWLPNLKVRYRLGREARRKAERIQSLIDQKPSGEVYDDPSPGRVDGTSEVISLTGDQGDAIFDSRASILEDVMNALDHEKHKVVGVYGPGGVGKTTLLEEVEKKLRKEGRPFDMIVKSKVSQTPDLKNIQDDIAYALKLDLNNEPSEVGRRDLLFKRLQKDPSEKILIILDDLWKEFDLKEVGIPSGDESKGCKLLLTSRFKDALEQMKCDTPIFHLEGLEDNEAFELFEKTVGDRLKDDEELKAIAPNVVKKLAGLPLLIVSVACSLKDRDVAAWRIALKKIDQSKMETIVKLSYDHLKSEDTKTLFLLCGLIGGTIQVETLLALGLGLGLFEEFRRTMQDSRDRLNTILDDLRSACLLLDGGNDKDNVSIHDLYSEVVVSTPFRGQNSLMMNNNYGSWRKEKLEKCWAICLADVGRDRLTELMTYKFLDLKILMLSQPNCWCSPHQHDTADCLVLSDFESMKELQVLYFSHIHVARLPSSIGVLGNLHSLYLDNCNVEDVANLGKLKALQILSLAGSALSRLPKEIGDLTNLRSLNLNNCNSLRIIEPGVLERLIDLEELYLQSSFDQWMGKDGILSESCNARLAELKSLTKITSLEISIPDPSVLSEDDDFPFGNLIKFWINIGKAKRGRIGGLRTMKLKLEEWDIILSKEWVQKILQKTQCLYLDGVNTPKSIANSPSIESIANSSNGLPLTAFTVHTGAEVAPIQVSLPHLEILTMVGLLGPEETLYSERSLKYSNLRVLIIRESKSCSKSILKLDWILKLPNLESMNIKVSLAAEVVFDLEELEVIEDVEILSRLTNLTLESLPNLQCVCKQDVKLQGISILRNLRDLYIYETGLSFLFSVSVAKCLGEIRTIRVSNCPNMKAVIVDEGRNERTYDIIEFPLLDSLSIDKCRMGKFFSYPCEKKELVTTTSYPQDAYSGSFFDQKVTFPNITTLNISGLQSKELWNNQIPSDSFQKLESLTLKNGDNLQCIGPPQMWKVLQRCLKNLKVISCRSIQIIYEGNGMDIETSELRRLVLRDLQNLRCIWPYDSLPNIPFPNLREVEAKGCPCLEVLLPTFTVKFLGQIEKLVVESCENMELIASHEKWEEATGTPITFSELTVLRLFELPKFKSFLPEKYSLKFSCSEDFPSLQVLSIKSCGAEPDQVLGEWPHPYYASDEYWNEGSWNGGSSCHII